MRVICTCIICRAKWVYKNVTEDQLDAIRASSSPCGHQGVFETKVIREVLGDECNSDISGEQHHLGF